jgi:hypothetical protein
MGWPRRAVLIPATSVVTAAAWVLAFSPDGRLPASCGNDDAVRAQLQEVTQLSAARAL